jgi:hypothetical protein
MKETGPIINSRVDLMNRFGAVFSPIKRSVDFKFYFVTESQNLLALVKRDISFNLMKQKGSKINILRNKWTLR